jgi:hypothetical protein
MTEAYGIGLKNAKIKFFSSISIVNLELNKKKELESTFNEFFYFLNKNSLLFKQSSDKIAEIICQSPHHEIILNNDEKANLQYFKKKTIQKDFFINSVRFTKQITVLTSTIDIKKKKRAAKAHSAQIYESAVSR